MKNDLQTRAQAIGELSSREREILMLATEGLTDREIADRLSISPRTVVSYWVRMRGKVGPLNRTEFVAMWLNERNAGQIREIREEAENAIRTMEDEILGLEGWALAARHKAILDALPEPVVAFDDSGMVVYANRWAETLFDYGPGQLEQMSVSKLFPPHRVEGGRMDVKTLLEVDEPRSFGFDSVIYAASRSGLMRVILLVHATDTPEGRIASCIVRSFINEVDHLRRRASAIVSHLA